MTNKTTKSSLLLSSISLLLCFAMLIGTTFAWFTDSATSAGNIIKAGNLDVEMYWADGTTNPSSTTTTWKDASKGAIFNYDLWEPGYTEVKHIKIANEGSLALKYQLAIVATDAVSDLADVIDVYFVDPATQVDGRAALVDTYKVGTLTEVLAGMPGNASGELLAETAATVTIALKMQESAGNEYQNLSIGSDFKVILSATQLTYEGDSFDDQYDENSKYPAIDSSKVTKDDVNVKIPVGAPEGTYTLEVTENTPVDNNGEITVSYDITLLLDGEKVSGTGHTYDVTIEVGQLLNIKSVLHNGEAVADFDYDSNKGTVTFKTNSFSPFAVVYTDDVVDAKAETADSLIGALEGGKDKIGFIGNIKIDPANMSNAYGKTGINIKNGQTIDGNGYTLDIKGAGGTWDSGINTTGGLIKNITITGSFRGIFINHNSDYSEPVVLEKVIIDGTTYTISCDQGKNQTLIAKNSTFNGWTSYAATLGSAEFTNCKFGEGSGYAYCRPYAPTAFVGCEFETGFRMDARAAVTFENCKIGGVALTADNLSTLVTSNIGNATVK